MTGRRKKSSSASGKKTGVRRRNLEAIQHKKDKRRNIPTRALKSAALKTLGFHSSTCWPRELARDPQLVWGGKYAPKAIEKTDLVVPEVGLQILEKIMPQAIVENLRAYAQGAVPVQPNLFGRNFNGLPKEFLERLEFYQHQGDWQNRMILGDSLQVMNSLLVKEGMSEKVQVCYIDPPYGIKFRSNWQVSTGSKDVKDNAKSVSQETEVVRAFRDTWEYGIHSYLTYLRDRLYLARELLNEKGSCFVQISEKNVHYVRCLLDEVFGVENFVAQITYKVGSGTRKTQSVRRVSDYILWYAKNKESMKFRRLFTGCETSKGSDEYHTEPLHSQGAGDDEPRLFKGKPYYIPAGSHWTFSKEKFDRLVKEERVVAQGKRLRTIIYHDDFPYSELTTTWSDTSPVINKKYVVQTKSLAIQRCVLMASDPGDLVFDPTCGSGTTAYVAEQWGRRWITADTSRIALAVARIRLMSANYDAYILAGTEEGRQEELKWGGIPLEHERLSSDANPVKFVYKRRRNTTLNSIGKGEAPPIEFFFDQPVVKENGEKARVSGPFTVEALLLPTRMAPMSSDVTKKYDVEQSDIDAYYAYIEKMLVQLKKGGVRGQTTDQRMKFASLELREGGLFVTAEGETESDPPLQAAVAFATEFAPIDRNFVDEAVKEIIGSEKIEILYVCGFEVESDVFDYVRNKFGNLVVQVVKMNPELHMASNLKFTDESNLFTVFGAPDIIIRKHETQEGGGGTYMSGWPMARRERQ